MSWDMKKWWWVVLAMPFAILIFARLLYAFGLWLGFTPGVATLATMIFTFIVMVIGAVSTAMCLEEGKIKLTWGTK